MSEILYRCTKSFRTDYYDDGNVVRRCSYPVEKGSIWEPSVTENSYSVRLSSVDDGSWLEMDETVFREYFEEVLDGKEV